MGSFPQLGQLVFSRSGRDKGRHYIVVGYQDGRVLVADGITRKMDRPKKMNPLHLKCRRRLDEELKVKLETTGKVTNSELRGALAKLLEQENNTTPEQGGEEKLG